MIELHYFSLQDTTNEPIRVENTEHKQKKQKTIDSIDNARCGMFDSKTYISFFEGTIKSPTTNRDDERRAFYDNACQTEPDLLVSNIQLIDDGDWSADVLRNAGIKAVEQIDRVLADDADCNDDATLMTATKTKSTTTKALVHSPSNVDDNATMIETGDGAVAYRYFGMSARSTSDMHNIHRRGSSLHNINNGYSGSEFVAVGDAGNCTIKAGWRRRGGAQAR